MMKFRAAAAVLLSLLLVGGVRAGDSFSSSATFRDLDSRFSRGSWEIENLSGAFFLFDRGGNERPTADFFINSTRVGIMLTNPFAPGLLHGNVEFLGELFAAPIFYGPGNILAGGTVFFRYNFIQPGARLVPYVQGGAGWVYTDLEQGRGFGQAIGQDFNFNLQAIGGVKFLLNNNWSINAEASYRHISNAGLSDPNYGVDHLGGQLGLSFSF